MTRGNGDMNFYTSRSDEEFDELARFIKSSLHAEVCLLSFWQSQTISPFAVAGAAQHEFQEARVHDFLHKCAGLLQFLPLVSVSLQGSQFKPLPRLAAKCLHSRHFQIQWENETALRLLVSLFYKEDTALEPSHLREAERYLHARKALFLSAQTETAPASFRELIGCSRAVQKIRTVIAQVAATNSDVLIMGETGTGKELVARTIHARSKRKESAFIPVDCVAIPANLLESELFGFEKGAFTGATTMKHGLFELADKGTLFLDEISELEINLQAKLLRVLQERQFRRLGGEEPLNVDMRVIAAMNQKPAQALAQGRMRKDLFYRLNIIPVHLPPLRRRVEDIPILAEHFLDKAVKKNSLPAKALAPEALVFLQRYPWPGNVRQLQNVIERLAVLTQHEVISVGDLPAQYRASAHRCPANLPFNEAKKRHLEKFEKDYFSRLLVETKFNITKAAEIAGISDRTIYRMLQRYNGLRETRLPAIQPSSE